MKAIQLKQSLDHSFEELLALTSDDETDCILEQKIKDEFPGLGDRMLQHGAYGIVESCQKVFSTLLQFGFNSHASHL